MARKQRSFYAKYHDKMNRMIKQCNEGDVTCVWDCHFKEYGEYLISRIYKEANFPLYRYCDVVYKDEFSLDLENLRMSENGSLNDVYEGISANNFDLVPVEKFIEELNNYAHIKCFTETYSNNLMWAHYANGARGVCVEYDMQKVDRDLLASFFPVYYSKERRIFMSKDAIMEQKFDDPTQNAIADAKGIFLQKADYWKYEKEWRVCFMNETLKEYQEKDKLLSFPYVSAIYLGPRISADHKTKVLQKVKEYENKHRYKLRVHQMRMNDLTYDLSAIEIQEE